LFFKQVPAKKILSENSPWRDYFKKQKILQGPKTNFFLQGPKLKRVIFAGTSAIFKPKKMKIEKTKITVGRVKPQ